LFGNLGYDVAGRDTFLTARVYQNSIYKCIYVTTAPHDGIFTYKEERKEGRKEVKNKKKRKTSNY